MTNIGWGVINRLKGKTSADVQAYSDVIFGKSQFRTSFSGKKSNPFAEAFLCPLKAQSYLDSASKRESADQLFKLALTTAESLHAEYEKSGIPKKYKGISNFFYPYSEFFGEVRPRWAKNKNPKKNRGYINVLKVATKPCIENYRLK